MMGGTLIVTGVQSFYPQFVEELDAIVGGVPVMDVEAGTGDGRPGGLWGWRRLGLFYVNKL